MHENYRDFALYARKLFHFMREPTLSSVDETLPVRLRLTQTDGSKSNPQNELLKKS